ncbi:hypothetical protein P9B03_12585 [Metasolibacillus meyeri]|uniref:Uncharacterized protein n=1 Tax=Metasolibacillus meyeri TaxID=1071052 RepID=A0AAW9NVR7_9BACL|nr:hypothetical protein [Metasolibacillus meyeri]MEC1179326.1 hypothetical protein [Metasolibacillus meyeri]
MNSVISMLIIGLIISQLIIFYLIVLLNNKVAKFKDLEVRQDQLMQEMDDAIGVYLIEMREENDRLLHELTAAKNTIPKIKQVEQEAAAAVLEIKHEQLSETVLKEQIAIDKKAFVPKNIAANIYKQQKRQEPERQQPSTVKPELEKQEPPAPKQEPLTPEQQIITMYKNGQSIEEIAKQTQKGKTEVELLIKFHS